jgi:hypothetical protein
MSPFSSVSSPNAARRSKKQTVLWKNLGMIKIGSPPKWEGGEEEESNWRALEEVCREEVYVHTLASGCAAPVSLWGAIAKEACRG